jgi:hypothetical protein
MTSELTLGGPTVTLFGTRDALDTAISDELGRRGRSIHTVSTPVGWLSSVTQAIIRLDTVAGAHALDDLMARERPATHVVAVCQTSDELTSARLHALCRRCGENHEVSLIWHPPFDNTLDDVTADPTAEPALAPGELAAAIADEVGHQGASQTSFTTQTFDPRHERGHA